MPPWRPAHGKGHVRNSSRTRTRKRLSTNCHTSRKPRFPGDVREGAREGRSLGFPHAGASVLGGDLSPCEAPADYRSSSGPRWDLGRGGGVGSEEFMASCSSQKHALGSAGRAPRPTCTALLSPLGSRRVRLFVPVRLRLRNLLKVTEGALGLEPGPGTSDLCCVMPLSVLGEGNK